MKTKNTCKSILFLALLVILLNACERDDLCSNTFQVTPNLVIEFYDINEPESPKPVANFGFVAVGTTDTIFINNVSEISLPLRTNQNSTAYLFATNTNNPATFNVDEVRFNYAINDVYVNRACGFRTEFLDLQALRINAQTPETNWIRNLSVQRSNIRDENEAHLYIFH